MTFDLPPGITFCEAAGRRIFLDLPNDRYFCLANEADAAFTSLLVGENLSADHLLILQNLETAGTLVRGDGRAPPSPCARRRPTGSVLDEGPLPRVGIIRVARAALALQRAKADLRRHPLAKLCASLAAAALPQKTSAHDRHAGATTLAAAFHAAGRVVDALEQCLAVSIAMTRTARKNAIDADLVFGVKLRPFQAHAWVEVDDIVISDRMDVIRQFTPILSL